LKMEKVLIYGYGNVGRKDDGLGVLCAQQLDEWIAECGLENVDVETNYQLNIEDAELISRYDRVFFIDASLETESDVKLENVNPDALKIEFSMHAISPAYVLHLCHTMFGKKPIVQLMHIKGYEWDFIEGLTPQARSNLNKASHLIKEQLEVVLNSFIG
jgi:hydrogenase maturation protease